MDTIKIDAPVPPMLELAVGYAGEARWIGMCWTPYGDELWLSDGRVSTTAGEWDGFLAFINHPTVEPTLRRFDLGSSESEATHWLIVDRQERTLYVTPTHEVDAFLDQQWPELPPEEEAQSSDTDLRTALNVDTWELVQDTIDHVRIRDLLADHQRVVQDMRYWLDQVQPPGAEVAL